MIALLLALVVTSTHSPAATEAAPRVRCALERDLYRDAEKAVALAEGYQIDLVKTERKLELAETELARALARETHLAEQQTVEITPPWVPYAVAGAAVVGAVLGAIITVQLAHTVGP